MGLAQPRHGDGEQPGCSKRQCANGDDAGVAGLDAADVITDAVDFGQDALGALQHGNAECIGEDATRRAIEDVDAERGLHFVEALCERWLADAERARRFGQIEMLGDGENRLELPQLQPMFKKRRRG
jgi:hypothetical protein